MKKTNLLLMMLISSAMVFTSCKDDGDTTGDNPEPPVVEVKEVTIGITGNNGEVITVSGTDIVKDVTIKATENVDRDIQVTLTTDAKDGNAVLSAATATIAKGTNNATVTITFPASKFPEGTAEKAIKVTAVTNADKVALSPAFTTFNVKGQGGVETPAILTAVATVLEINTTDAAGVAEINFSLSKAMDADITVLTGYETPADLIDIEGVVWDPATVVIAKNTTALKVKITVPQGRVGSLPIGFFCENSKVNVETKKITFTFVKTPNPEASISPALTIVEVKGADIQKTMTITLNKTATKDVTVKLGVISSSNTLTGTLSEQFVTFTGDETSKNVDITFTAADFGNDKAAVVTVTITSDDTDIKASASTAVFNVSGPSTKQDGQIEYTFFRADEEDGLSIKGAITFTDAEKAQGYIYISVYGKATNAPYDEAGFDPAVTFDYEVSGDLSRDDIVLSEGEDEIGESAPFSLVHYGVYSYGDSYFKLMKSAIGKTGKLMFTSPGTTFAPNQGWEITIN